MRASIGKLLIAGGACAILASSSAWPQQTAAGSIDARGTVSAPAFDAPYSDIASEAAKRNFLDLQGAFKRLAQGPANPTIEETRQRVDELLMRPGLERLRAVFPVTITAAQLGGVGVDVVEPRDGVAPRNHDKVLVNLHGGGFLLGAGLSGQMEAVPIASIGGYKVVTVDYRMAPEYAFPAASEDVAAVYRALLETYRPEDIGLYGCSAGGMLTAQSLAWFARHDLPMPGAAGMFHGAALVDALGDSAYIAPALSGGRIPSASPGAVAYFEGADLSDPLVSPVRDRAILAAFPPSLLISGTRDLFLSSVIYSHAQLVDVGVEADLHVWEGAGHCSFAQPVADPDVPETQQAWKVIVSFFDRHLGKSGSRN